MKRTWPAAGDKSNFGLLSCVLYYGCAPGAEKHAPRWLCLGRPPATKPPPRGLDRTAALPALTVHTHRPCEAPRDDHRIRSDHRPFVVPSASR